MNDGRAFIEATHPGAKDDFAEQLRQMETTVVGLAEVTKVVSGYRFVPKGNAPDLELARFNDYLMDSRRRSRSEPSRSRSRL